MRTKETGTDRADSRLLRAVESLPPLPAVALKVMQVAQDPKSSASDLAIVISSDPGLSARILKIVNSAAYRRSREITSVQEALVMLGFVQARNVAISGAIAGSYAPDARNALFRIESFWRHSIAVAFRASELAGKSRRIDVPTAFTTGILHNMGRLAMFYFDAAGLDQAVAEAMRQDIPLEEAEADLLGYDHCEVGALLAEKWHLPVDVADAIRHHHGAHEDEHTLRGVVSAADYFCESNGLSPGYVIPGPVGQRGNLGQPGDDFLRLMKQVEALMVLVSGNPVGVRSAA
jgi:putative nucleotidyltransferase with HDIG domain